MDSTAATKIQKTVRSWLLGRGDSLYMELMLTSGGDASYRSYHSTRGWLFSALRDNIAHFEEINLRGVKRCGVWRGGWSSGWERVKAGGARVLYVAREISSRWSRRYAARRVATSAAPGLFPQKVEIFLRFLGLSELNCLRPPTGWPQTRFRTGHIGGLDVLGARG